MLHDDPPLESSPLPTCAPISLLHSTAHPQITVYSSSVRQKISLLRRSRRKKGGGERRGAEWSDMDQRQTNWQVIQLTRASLTERSGGRMPPGDGRDGGRTHGINPGHGYVMFLPPSLRPSVSPSVRRHYGGGLVLLITQIEVNCGLDRNYAPPPCLAWLWNIA